MRPSRMMIAVLFLAALGAIAWAGRQESPKVRTAWEYTWIKSSGESPDGKQVGQLGDRGWEMVAVTRHEEMFYNSRQVYVTCYFKRPNT